MLLSSMETALMLCYEAWSRGVITSDRYWLGRGAGAERPCICEKYTT